MNIQEVIDRLRRANLRINPEKCKFDRTALHYLGHLEQVARADSNKIRATNSIPAPKTTKYRRFLGIVSQNRRLCYASPTSLLLPSTTQENPPLEFDLLGIPGPLESPRCRTCTILPGLHPTVRIADQRWHREPRGSTYLTVEWQRRGHCLP